MPALPHCDDLFLQFFDPWYDDADRRRRGFNSTFPDLLQDEDWIGLSQADASRVTEQAQQVIEEQVERMVEAVRGDWPTYLSVRGDIDLDWIDAFDTYYDRDRIREVIDRSDPTIFDNDYLVLCCEFGAALSHVLRVGQPRLVWRLDWPYWDSSLLDPRSGTAIAVFHWAIKKMSEYGVDDGFGAKAQVCLQMLDD